MAWEWSHSTEAYAAVEKNIRSQERSWLEVVFAEWMAGREDFDQEKYDRALVYAKRPEVESSFLADAICERTQEQATCENGGFRAWCCPYGCVGHMVSFEVENAVDPD